MKARRVNVGILILVAILYVMKLRQMSQAGCVTKDENLLKIKCGNLN